MILEQVRSQAELRQMIENEEARQLEALNLALQQPFQPLTVRKLINQKPIGSSPLSSPQPPPREWKILQP